MPTIYGASKQQWDDLIGRGLIADLLPVVSNPKAKISAASKMRAIGKTPSTYNGNGEVVGIPQWVEKMTTLSDVRGWMLTPDYGICLQTRNVRALDIDIDDASLAHQVVEYIAGALDFPGFPVRSRENSGKCLVAFRLPGQFPKRILRTAGGNIEFLGNGQQFIAAGTHPSGVPYSWEWVEGDTDFPEWTAEEFEKVWSMLQTEFGIEEASTANATRKRGVASNLYADEYVDKLDVLGEGPSGQLYIECPWKEAHTSDTGEVQTCYFPRGTNGYQQGHFHCFHASCQKYTKADFEDALGLRQGEFSILTDADIPTGKTAAELPLLYRDNKGRPEATVQNVHAVLLRSDLTGIELGRDAFTESVMFRSVNTETWTVITDEDYTMLREKFDEMRFKAIGRELIRDVVDLVAREQVFDSAKIWLDEQKWDGVGRIDNFLAQYLGAEDSPYTRGVSVYLWTALAGRIASPGVKADMVPILVGEQGTGKSSAVKLIAPFDAAYTEIRFDDKEDDLARRMRGKVVAELGELRGLHTRDLETIKAFVTRSHEEWIPKYRESLKIYPRRCVFVGTTNQDEFLADTTGNRRWLPVRVDPGRIACGRTEPEKEEGLCALAALARDKSNLYAEARDRFLVDGVVRGVVEKLAIDVHAEFMVRDPWVEMVEGWLHREDLDGQQPILREFLLVGDALREAVNLNTPQISKREEMRMAAVLHALGYEKRSQRVDGRVKKVWFAAGGEAVN